MKILVSILALFVVMLASVTAHLYSELRAERDRASPQVAVSCSERLSVATLEQERVALRPDGLQAQGRLTSVSQPLVSGQAAAGEPTKGAEGCALPATGYQSAGPSRDLQEAALRRVYPRLAQELHLAPDEEARVVSLLLEQRNKQMDAMRKHEGDRAATTRVMDELRRRNETELMSVLGDRYLQFEAYQKSLGERMHVEGASVQLEAAGIPLRDDQRRELLAVMVDERDRIPRPAWLPRFSLQQSTAKQEAWQLEYEERVRDRAASVLSADQLRQYDVYRNLQSRKGRG